MKTKSTLIGIMAAALVALLGCSSSSSSGTHDCTDAGAVNGTCDSIASDIIAHGATSGTCDNPPANFAAACAKLKACRECVGN